MSKRTAIVRKGLKYQKKTQHRAGGSWLPRYPMAMASRETAFRHVWHRRGEYRKVCLFKDNMDDKYTWDDLGLVLDGFTGGIPENCDTSIIPSNASMEGTGLYSLRYDAAVDWYNYKRADGFYANRISELENPIPIKIVRVGGGLYWTIGYASSIGYAKAWNPPTYNWIAYLYFYPFIEILNNRGHYLRLFHAANYPMLFEDDTMSIDINADIQANGRSYLSQRTWTRYTLREPTIAWVDIASIMADVFLDIDKTWNAETGKWVYTVLNNAKFWLVGAGVLSDGRIYGYGGYSELNINIDRNTICPVIPKDAGINIIEADVYPYFYNDPVFPYYIPAVDKEWPYWNQSYENEADMP